MIRQGGATRRYTPMPEPAEVISQRAFDPNNQDYICWFYPIMAELSLSFTHPISAHPPGAR